MTLWVAERCKSEGPDDILSLGDIRDQCFLSTWERIIYFRTCTCPIEDWDGNIPTYVNLLEAQRLPRLDGRARVLYIANGIACLYDGCTWSDVVHHLRTDRGRIQWRNHTYEAVVPVCNRNSCLRALIFKAFVNGHVPDTMVFNKIEPYINLEHDDLSMVLRRDHVGERRLKDLGPISELEGYESFINSTGTDGHRERVLAIITDGPRGRAVSVWSEGGARERGGAYAGPQRPHPQSPHEPPRSPRRVRVPSRRHDRVYRPILLRRLYAERDEGRARRH